MGYIDVADKTTLDIVNTNVEDLLNKIAKLSSNMDTFYNYNHNISDIKILDKNIEVLVENVPDDDDDTRFHAEITNIKNLKVSFDTPIKIIGGLIQTYNETNNTFFRTSPIIKVNDVKHIIYDENTLSDELNIYSSSGSVISAGGRKGDFIFFHFIPCVTTNLTSDLDDNLKIIGNCFNTENLTQLYDKYQYNLSNLEIVMQNGYIENTNPIEQESKTVYFKIRVFYI